MLIDQFLEDAIEVDVDAVSDGTDVVIGGIMEHIERAGVHSGDSACSLPPYSIDAEVQADIRRQTVALARELGVVGLMNVQFAVKDRVVYVLEVNPRASRTVPFVSQGDRRAAGEDRRPLHGGAVARASRASRARSCPAHVSVKEAVFPFIKFPGVDTVLGPEMKSTGEVMGIDASFGAAFAKAQIAAGTLLPDGGQRVRLGAARRRRRGGPDRARLARAGFRAARDARHGGAPARGGPRRSRSLNKVQEGPPAHRRRAPARRGGARDQHAVGRGVVPRLLPHPADGARVPRAVLHDPRGGGRRGRGHRDHRARTGHGAPAAGAPPVAGR